MPRAWAIAARQPPAQENGEAPVTVLVTGFGPFLHHPSTNSSWDIASTLPALLPATLSQPTPIHIHVHHFPLRVAYTSILSLIPKLLPPENPAYPAPTLILHIGLAAGRTFYTLEQGAHKLGYAAIPDVDGVRFNDAQSDAKFPPQVFPPALQTGIDARDALMRWRGNLVPRAAYDGGEGEKKGRVPDVRLTPDAGNFLCGFTYWNSLAHYHALGEGERPVAFLHVPDLSKGGEEELRVGREVTVALIRALVESWREKGAGNNGNAGSEMGEGKNVRAGTDVNFAA
ncbi:peptidase C15, pyroglutamyl peptidase I-like protein [Polyplosphaeria fusca]|uniref:Peptidase C15, pyroglutamyl peptidase I-like protein n=1 Tax=Polyplosphaeria fusca TaxID=682080 RepID=A0A9P4V0Y4_9PLEO|nr:peptidase C15, pyroglutamyl peptidase I-like protein [Polyplosphaeria fusca]